MKPWNSRAARLGCAGLCLVLIGCGGSDVPDPESDSHAATGQVPAPQGSTPPVVAQNEPATAPAPAPAPAAEPATAPATAPTATAEPPAPAPASTAIAGATPASTPAPTPTTTASEAAPAPPGPDPAAAVSGSVASTHPAAESPKAAQAPAEATPGKPAATGPAPETGPVPPATRSNPALAAVGGANPQPGPPGAAPTPAPAAGPAADPKAAAAENPFAVFSETSSTAPAAGGANAPGAVPGNPAPEGAQAEPDPPAAAPADGAHDYLTIAMANRGAIKDYKNPFLGAKVFMDAVQKKDLAKMAEATALRAPDEAKSGKNRKLFAAILKQDLAQEDLDELSKMLTGYRLTGNNQPKSTGMFGVTYAKMEGTSTMVRTINMRLEKAGWKVVDISGRFEIEKPVIMPGMRGRTGGRR